MDAATFGHCLEALLTDRGVDAVIAAAVPTALGDPITAVTRLATRTDTPVLAVRLGQLATVAPLAGDGDVPVTASYADPAAAVAVLARAARYAEWLRTPRGRLPELPGLDIPAALELLRHRFEVDQEGGWLTPAQTAALLRAFGIPVIDTRTAYEEQDAVAAFHDLGTPVVKAIAEGVLHKSGHGGVLLDLRDEHAVRAAVRTLRDRFGTALRGVVVQPMAERGRELLVGVTSDEVFGPLVLFGLDGVDTDLIADRTARLTPLTDTDAEALLRGLRSSGVLFGPRSTLDAAAVRDVLLRVGRLAELLPEVAELDLNPLVVGSHSCRVLDARIRVRPRQPTDPFLRRLRA